MTIWQSSPLHVDGIAMDVRTNAAGQVIVGKQVGDVYAADTVLTPDQARSLAVALIEGADKAEGISGDAATTPDFWIIEQPNGDLKVMTFAPRDASYYKSVTPVVAIGAAHARGLTS